MNDLERTKIVIVLKSNSFIPLNLLKSEAANAMKNIIEIVRSVKPDEFVWLHDQDKNVVAVFRQDAFLGVYEWSPLAFNECEDNDDCVEGDEWKCA